MTEREKILKMIEALQVQNSEIKAENKVTKCRPAGKGHTKQHIRRAKGELRQRREQRYGKASLTMAS